MRVFLSGEGPTELGEWFNPPSYRADPPRPGVLQALLEHAAGTAVQVVGAIDWKHIVKYRGGVRAAESRTVLGLALHADEVGADALVFARDNDRDDRESAIERGIEHATVLFPALRLVGAAAVEDTEAWLLAIAGRLNSEGVRNSKAIAASELGLETSAQKTEFVRAAGVGAVPADARSLRRWINRAMAAFTAGEPP